jgi:hypothetical protein
MWECMHKSIFSWPGTSWRWAVRFTPRPLYLRGKNSRYPSNRRLGGPQTRSGRRGEYKILDPTKTRAAHSQSLYRLFKNCRSPWETLSSVARLHVLTAVTEYYCYFLGCDAVCFGSRYKRFEGMCCHHRQGKTVVYSEDGTSMFLRNVVAYPPNYTASHSRRQYQPSTPSDSWVFNVVSYFKYDIYI